MTVKGPIWRVGNNPFGRTLFRGDVCVGMVDTEAIAEEIVAAMNGTPIQWWGIRDVSGWWLQRRFRSFQEAEEYLSLRSRLPGRCESYAGATVVRIDEAIAGATNPVPLAP
jgi:hypothetical protein